MSLTLVAYQRQARSTALYPDLNKNFGYPTLGLAGECGEVCEKILDFIEHRTVDFSEVKKEIGDMFWYCASVCSEFRIDMSDYQDLFDEAGPFTVSSADDPSNLHLTNLLSKQVGKICERVKKIYRDKGGVCDNVDQETVHDAMQEVISILVDLSLRFGYSPQEVAQANLDKLASRMARGKIQGDGDNR